MRYRLLVTLLVATTALGSSAGSALAQSAAASPARPPMMAGPVFDAYLDARIAIRREAPALDAELASRTDARPIVPRLGRFLTAAGLSSDEFVQAHGMVGRDTGLRGRVDAILDRHSQSGFGTDTDKVPPAGGAVLPPSGPRPGGKPRRSRRAGRAHPGATRS